MRQNPWAEGFKKYCVLVALLSLFLTSQTAYAMPGWTYTVPVAITNISGSTLTNYQVLIELDTQTPITQGKMRPDGGDIRFATDWDGTTLIEYWIESGINTPDTRIWVRVPSLPAPSVTTIYLFYGNPSATGQSNFASTFPNRYQLTSGSDTLAGTQTYDWFEVSSGATLNVQDGQMLTVQARVIRIDGTIDGSAAGYDGAKISAESDGSGPGFGHGSHDNGGGAGYGGQGGCAPASGAEECAAPRGDEYGTADGSDIDRGSGGGSGRRSPPGDQGGDGGGAVWLQAKVVEVTGLVEVNGEDGTASGAGRYGGGGGSGGGTLIQGDQIDLSGATLSARGGRAGNRFGAAGGGGRIKVFYSDFLSGAYSTDVVGETTHTYGGTILMPDARGLDGTTFAGTFTSTEPTVSIGSEMASTDLSITKTVTPSIVEPGQVLTYTLTFSNAGPVTATNVLIVDTVPVTLTNPGFTSSGATINSTGGINYVWQVEDLAPDGGGVITITGVLSTGLSAGYTFTNTATITTTLESDASDNSGAASVTVSNVPPVAVDDITSTGEDTPVSISVLTNDVDLNGDTLSVAAAGAPVNGMTTISGTTGVVYTPTPGFSGTDTFTYTVSDGSLTDVATVVVIVTSDNTLPTISDIPDQTTDMGTVVGPIPFTIGDVETPADALVLSGESSGTALVPDGNIVFGGSGTNRTVTITPTESVSGTATITITVDDGLDTASDTFELRVAVGEVPHVVFTYLPLIVRNYVVAPDLVVKQIIATSDSVQVVVENQGNAPVADEFWVDVYINPDTAPTAVNQVWDQLGSQGLVWGITEEALPSLAPGGVITLVTGDDYYVPEYSAFGGALAEGTPVYAQVDSFNAGITYGAVLESHEIAGGAYNNIGGPVFSTATFGVTGAAVVEMPVMGDHWPAFYSNLPRRQ